MSIWIVAAGLFFEQKVGKLSTGDTDLLIVVRRKYIVDSLDNQYPFVNVVVFMYDTKKCVLFVTAIMFLTNL